MKSQKFLGALIIFILSAFCTSVLHAAPIWGKAYELRQPDGSKVPVKIWGDEFYQRVESPDGYTLIRNSEGWICYADVNAAQDEMFATDRVYYGPTDDGVKVKTALSKQDKMLNKGLKLKRSAVLEKHRAGREALGYEQLISPTSTATDSAKQMSPSGIEAGVPLLTEPLVGEVHGLVICVQFPDEEGTITAQQIDDYCNLEGYNEFGNNGSVRDFYYDMSGGNLTYTNVVMGYYTAAHDKSYYDDPARDAGDAGRELLAEALAWLEEEEFDFTQLSIDSTNSMLAINLFYAGQVDSGWAMGLWPHSGYYGEFVSSSGVRSGRYQITDMGASLEIGTFCHENGHMICHWPDLYDYGYESSGVGMFCLMAAGNYDGLNPVPANAYFRDIKGWEAVTEMDSSSGPNYMHVPNTASSFRYSNPNKPTEFFYIESRRKVERNASLPDEGLMIWHVDEMGSNDYEQMTPSQHYLVSLEQADGRFDMETNPYNNGDAGDLFDLAGNSLFNDTTRPDAKWWDGTGSGLNLRITSELSDTITFETTDSIPPLPNPMEWKVAPRAVGKNTVYMEAVTATDSSGVEYRFVCLTNNSFSSPWQDSPVYYQGGFDPNTYEFAVMARDKSPYQNKTEPSEALAVTVPVDDTLAPYPDPASWLATPRKLSNTRIAMEAAQGFDEIVDGVPSIVEYRFKCVYTNDENYESPEELSREWGADPLYMVSGLSVSTPGNIYRFQVQMRDACGNETEWSEEAEVILAPPPQVRHVPTATYKTIQDAIDAANHGDTILLDERVYREININFKGKLVTVTSRDPEDPACVASTIIDCQEPEGIWGHETRRAFIFQNGESRNAVLAGVTITNATAIDEAENTYSFGYLGISKQWQASPRDGQDAYGGAILIGQAAVPSSPTIRNCIFSNCSARGVYGQDGESRNPGFNQPGLHGDRGGNGGNAYGGAIYAYAGSAPLLKECQFLSCAAIGGDAGDGADGSTGGEPADGTPGLRGGDGGDAGLGGCAWGGAIYFEPNCLPEMYDVTISDCLVMVGEAGRGGNGGNGSNAKTGFGGDGGNGGIGGDLRAPDSSGGAVYFGPRTEVTIDGCVFERCQVVAELSGDYSGGNGGHGGDGSGAGMPGGNGGHGGPAYYIPDKMVAIGGVDATGGTGGNGGNGGDGGPRGTGGNGGFRHGQGGSPGGGSFGSHTGIFPSNIYYMAYYWEDTMNLDNPPISPDEHFQFAYGWEWLSPDLEPATVDVDVYDPIDPNVLVGTYQQLVIEERTIFDSPYSPYFGLLRSDLHFDPDITIGSDPNDPTKSVLIVDESEYTLVSIENSSVQPLSPTNAAERNAGACAGANFYGENSIITMTNSQVSYNRSFSNHGGGELYDKGCEATFENCKYEGNGTAYNAATDYALEGYGGAIFADQPTEFKFTDECEFSNNIAYAGGAIYCNFAPSGEEDQILELTDSTFTGNKADSHFMYSYGGAVYAGNSLQPYEEYYFNYMMDYRVNDWLSYSMLFSDPDFLLEYETFVSSIYDHSHGIADFWNPIGTALWGDEVEVDHVLRGQEPVYSVSVTNSEFRENLAPYGSGLYADASVLTITGTEFVENIGTVGVGGYVYASEIESKSNLFNGNLAGEITTRGVFSEEENARVVTYGAGAGLYVTDSDLQMVNQHFVSNQSTGTAGALQITGPSISGVPQALINSLFVENTAGLEGGAVVADGVSDVSVVNCTFTENEVNGDLFGAGGGLFCHNAFVEITNSIFWLNMAGLGPQIAVGDPLESVQPYDPDYIPYSTVFVNYSCVQDGEPGIFVADGDAPWLWYGSRNIESDPKFIAVPRPTQPVERTFYLWQHAAQQLDGEPDSECLDSGNMDASELSTLTGFDHVTSRTDHEPDTGPVDLGYHYEASLPVNYFTLVTEVIPASDRKDHGTISPEQDVPHVYMQGVVIGLTATPESELYRVKQWVGTENDLWFGSNNRVLMDEFRRCQVEFEQAVPRNLYVPESYDSIEDAILAARDDDTIVLAPDQVYLIEDPNGLNFGGKQLVVRSADPNDPAVVASTVIDCRGSRYVSKRAFHFANGEGNDSKIEGVTIRNAFTAKIGLSGALPTGMWPWPFESEPDPLPPNRALSGTDGTGDSWGGAILCTNGSSPTIRNCVFENCTVAGGIGGDGDDGMYPPNMITDEDLDSQSGGHSGKGTGNGYGGAIAVVKKSSPKIVNCIFKGNRATGGWGGIPGDAGRSYNNGRYGWGGNDWSGISYAALYGVNPEAGYGEGDGHGGAIYVEAECAPQIVQCTFEDNYARPGYVNPGGSEAGGSAYPEPWDADPWGEQGMRDGRDGRLITFGTTAGGALFLQEGANVTVEGCTFKTNEAYNQYTPESYGYSYNYSSSTRGGAIHCDPNSVLTIRPLCVDPENTIGTEFVGNQAGAIYCSSGVTLTVDKASFVNNISTRQLDNEDALLVVDDYAGNDYVISGGITIDRDANTVALITDSEFYGNASEFEGGAIRTESDLTLLDCVLNGNTSSADGGAIFAYTRVPAPEIHTIKVCFEQGEMSGNQSQGFGGAIFGKNVDVILKDVFMVRNSAFSGGALRLSYGQLDMDECVVYENVATGVITGTHRSVTAEGFGGGLHIVDSPFKITHTRFEKNAAKGVVASGGALCVSGNQSYYSQELFNCLLVQNTSENIGGAITVREDANVELANCTLADNVSAAGSEEHPTKAWDSEKNYLSNEFVVCNNGVRYKSKIANVGQNPVAEGIYWEKAAGGAIYVDHRSYVCLERSIVSDNKGIAIYEHPGAPTSNTQSKAYYSIFCSNAGGDVFDGGEQSVLPATDVRLGYENILTECAEFATSELGLGEYYLKQSNSPAVNPAFGGSYPDAEDEHVGLDTYTTSVDNVHDSGLVDLGFHYIPVDRLPKYTLNACYLDEDGFKRTNVGDLEIDGTKLPEISVANLPRGAMMTLTAYPKDEFYLTGWSGGTFNDNSLESENYAMMTRDKDICVTVRPRQTLYVGGSGEFDTLSDAIEAAQDGDIILVAPGQYTAASQYPSGANSVYLSGKKITISGYAPADEAVTRSTVFREFRFVFSDLEPGTVIEGITFNQSHMMMKRSDATIRNCVFRECRFSESITPHLGAVPAGTDGYHGIPCMGGAIMMFDSDPEVINCIFEDNWARGAHGENGFGGAESHPTGGDGGWPGGAYGGAVYCGLSSQPKFKSCTFTGNQVFGGNGGNGANGWVHNGNIYNGGRGGGWVYDPTTETYLQTVSLGGWDGWTNNSYGDKYGSRSIYYMIYLQWFDEVIFGQYDLEQWAKWFGWGNNFTSWEQFDAAFSNNTTDPLGDPYDQKLESWRYSGYGGAVYCEFDCHASFDDCVFENNQSYGGLTGVGGVQPNDRSPWPDRQLNMPTAGGAVYAAWDSDLTFTRCLFRDNVADTSTVDLPHTFSVSFGGAVAYENDCVVKFDDCDIWGNEATVGGGIYGRYATSEITNSNVFNNEAYVGAGVYLERDEAAIERTVFQANTARTPTPVVEPVDPEEPTDPEEPVIPAAILELEGMGGGLYAHLLKVSVRDSVFVDNAAQISGGGLQLSGTVEEPSEVFNTLFTSNNAQRDGGGASINWLSRVDFGNCTFADNRAVDRTELFNGYGGGLFVGTNSTATVTDSIFWGNVADEGTHISVSTASEFDDPAELNIGHSLVGSYPSIHSIYQGTGAELHVDPNVFTADPVFVSPANSEPTDTVSMYFLDQSLSPCVDAGSAMAASVGLDGLTTSPVGARDRGVVDLGYHYRFARQSDCAKIDEALLLSGKIDLADMAYFLAEWLSEDCAEPLWCGGSDLNFDGVVNFDDLAAVTFCWDAEDTEAPNQGTIAWAVEPEINIDPEDPDVSGFSIKMEAMTVQDNWWPYQYTLPGETTERYGVTYMFDCVEPTGAEYDSGWQHETVYKRNNLPLDKYTYQLIAKDGSGNMTAPTSQKEVKPILPKPDWAVLPNVNVDNYVEMAIEPLTADIGADVYWRYVFTINGIKTPLLPDPTYINTDSYAEGDVLTIQGTVALYRDSGDAGSEPVEIASASTDEYLLTFRRMDSNPPLPDPAQHEVYSPEQRPIGSKYYHQVTAVPAADVDQFGELGEENVNVEYKFICVGHSDFSSGGEYDRDGLEWRSLENVTGLLYHDNRPQVPQQYLVPVGSLPVDFEWEIIVRDSAGNETTVSARKSIQNQ